MYMGMFRSDTIYVHVKYICMYIVYTHTYTCTCIYVDTESCQLSLYTYVHIRTFIYSVHTPYAYIYLYTYTLNNSHQPLHQRIYLRKTSEQTQRNRIVTVTSLNTVVDLHWKSWGCWTVECPALQKVCYEWSLVRRTEPGSERDAFSALHSGPDSASASVAGCWSLPDCALFELSRELYTVCVM